MGFSVETLKGVARDIKHAIIDPSEISNAKALIKTCDIAKAAVIGLAILVGAAAFASGTFVGIFFVGLIGVATHDAIKMIDNVKVVAQKQRGDLVRNMDHISLQKGKEETKIRAGFGTIFAKHITDFLIKRYVKEEGNDEIDPRSKDEEYTMVTN